MEGPAMKAGHIAGIASIFLLLAPSIAMGGDSISLAVGTSKVVTLEANPSTGYAWRVDEAQSGDCAVAEFAGYRDKPDAAGRIGAPRLADFAITGAKPGECAIVLVYDRSWESKPPARTHTIAVTVE